jgi:hypothetical protein
MEAAEPSAGPIVAYVQGILEHLDHDACALSAIVDGAEKVLRQHEEPILACALLSIARVLGSGIGDLRDDVNGMVKNPEWNPAASKGGAA